MTSILMNVQVKASLMQSRLRAAIQAWKDAAVVSHDSLRLAEHLAEQRQKACLIAAFIRMQEHAMAQQRLRRLLQRAVQLRAIHNISSAFQGWLACYEEHRWALSAFPKGCHGALLQESIIHLICNQICQ